MSLTHSSNLRGAALHTSSLERNLSNPNSQDSSFTEASTTQLSQTEMPSTAIFQQSNSNTRDSQITASSSSSPYSSQENVIINTGGNPQASQPAKLENSITNRVALTDVSQSAHTGGHKRTATGQIKSPSNRSLPQSPTDPTVNGHSRTSSGVSGGQIAEMTSVLRVRMSYAKTKVDLGMESRNISELERMTSAQASPVSASPYTARHTTPSGYSPVEFSLDSPAQREASTSVPLEYQFPRSQTHADFHNAGNLLNGLAAPGSTARPVATPTYEQFWESHSNPSLSKTSRDDTQSLNLKARSLAPPVDLYPRSTTSHKQKPPVSASNRYPDQLPSTPPIRGSALARERTSVEQDALEGLLSMTSPANSQSHSARPLLQSPLREKTTEPSLLLNGIVNGILDPLTEQSQSTNHLRALNDDEFNKILDDMPESSSDEDVVDERRFPASQLRTS